jgi:hypothetical protein
MQYQSCRVDFRLDLFQVRANDAGDYIGKAYACTINLDRLWIATASFRRQMKRRILVQRI